ncbi:MAG: DUF502 domain-containing protein [Bacteroidales bacterium]|jgi:uncharacterized membrane protein|nr:DUF502 domain-containing protein [Bacteroidales bacterium]
MKRLIRYFLQGLLYIAPLGLTVFILYQSFVFLDGIFSPFLEKYLHLSIPGISLLMVFLLVALLGLAGQSILARPVKKIVNRIMEKAPLVKVIYSSLKDLLSAFVGKEKKFSQPVLVKVNLISDLEKLGFLTQEDVSNLGIEGKKVSVYFPHSYNFSGELFIVPAKHVRKIDVPPSDVMKFIVSGGVTTYSNRKLVDKKDK